MNKRLLIIIGIILIAVSIPFTVWLVKQQQQYKSQAAIPGGKIKVTLTPEKGTFLVGQETPVKIDLDTQGEEIQGAELSLFYRYGNADPELIVVDKDDSKAGTQLKRERTDVNYIDYDVSNNLVSKVMNIKLSVWSQMPNYIRTDPGKSMTLATIYFKALSVPANPTVALEFDNTNRYENNVATTKNGVLDELDIPVNGSYTISNAEIQNPIISGINPSSGKVGDAVAISGSNFGTSKGTVKFGDKTASDNDTTWGDKSITTKVPSGLSAGAFQITVTTTDSKTSGGVSFTITDNPPNKTLNPTISSINPSSGKVGDAVAISGSNFGTSKGTVKFGDKSVGDLEVTWGDSSISVKVPSLSAGTIKVKIITSDSKTSGEISFEVKASTSDSKENKISDNGGNSGNNNNSNNGNTSSNSSTNNPTGSTSSTTKTLKITNTTSNQTLNLKRPTFRGTASPSSIISITVRSNTITSTTTADANGNWSWTPSEDLDDGTHTITVSSGSSSSSVSFIVNASGTALPNSGETTPTIALTIVSFLALLGGFGLLLKTKRKDIKFKL